MLNRVGRTLPEVDQRPADARSRINSTISTPDVQIAALRNLIAKINTHSDMPKVLQEVAFACRGIVDSAMTEIVLCTAEGSFETVVEEPKELSDILQRLNLQSLTQQIIEQDTLQYISDTTADPRTNPDLPARGIRSCAGLPIHVGKGAVGVLFVYSSRINAFEKQLNLLGLIAEQADIALKQAQLSQEIQRLRESQDHLPGRVPFPLAVLNENPEVAWANQAFYRAFGSSGEGLKAETLPFGGLTKLNAAGLGHSGREMEVRSPGTEEESRWFNARLTPLPPSAEERFLLSLEDITDRKRSQEKLQEVAQLISLGELTAGVAHELNNPLTAILGFSQLLMAQELGGSAKEDMLKIYGEAQRAARIVQGLLSFARRRRPMKEYTDVSQIVDRVLALKTHDLMVNNIEVTRDYVLALSKTMADEHLLLQVFLNLINNAEQAILDAGNGGHLIIRAQASNVGIKLSFIDDGPGIPQENLEKVFEPFFTTKGGGKGTGLGLSICRSIIRGHGGDVWVESQPGQGAAFYIQLPLTAPQDTGYPEASVATSRPIAGRRLLVVDDEPSVRDLLSRILSADGHTVCVAQDGEEMWQALKGERYDCILLDLKMPGANGIELHRQIARTDPDQARRVIFVTGDVVNAETQAFIQGVRNPTLAKPFNFDQLRHAIQDVEE